MKKTKLQRITSLALTVLMVLGMVAASAGQTYAASSKWQLIVNSDNYAGDPVSQAVEVVKWNDNGPEEYAKILKVTSSNKKVVKITKEKWGGKTHYSMYFKKVGKSKLTVKYKTPDGKTKTIKKTIKVKKCPKAIKELSINGKSIKMGKDTMFLYKDYNYKKKTAKIKMALEDGWKIENASADANNWKTGKSKSIKVNKSTFTKGKQFKIPSGYNWVDINISMRKGDKYFHYYIGLGKE